MATGEILKVGEVLADTYEIRGLLGAGGFGEVYEALDRELSRAVAVKVARSATGEELLWREGRATAAVRHPSMVTVHRLGRHGAIPFLVMERLYGVSLAEHMDRRLQADVGFSIAEALDLVRAVAEGLAAVHRAGLVHHDVKPSNIMLSVDRRVVLLDLGVFASEFGAANEKIGGSPKYMAPEIIMNSGITGARHLADVYGLGVLAFELLTGRVPFTAREVGALLHQHLAVPPPPLADLRPDAPPALCDLVARLLSKDPADRPQAMDLVVDDLGELRAGRALAAEGVAPSLLLVDDDPDVLALLKSVVARVRPDAQVRTAADANEALRAIRQAAPDYLLLDMGLPDMSGLQMCLYLRGARLGDRCRIVMVSGHLDEPESELLRQLGVLDFVPKGPALGSKLRALLSSLLS
jgi:serine/threonine-protein kinase